MMKRLLLFCILTAAILSGCKNPVDNISVVIDGNVIHYKTTIILTDPAGAALPAFTVAVTGQDSAHVYDYSGLKAISSANGVITLGIHPDFEPLKGKDVVFNVVVSAANYETRVIPVSIAAGQYSQVLNVSVLKISATSTSASVNSRTTVLNAGKLLLTDNLATPLTTSITERTTVTLAAGSTFKGVSAALISSSPLLERIVHYNTRSASLLSLFPGASFSSSNVIGADGNKSTAFLIPAAFASVDMTVGAQDVLSLGQTFNISQQLNPDYVPVATGQKVKVGDQLNVYSYNYLTGQWKFESKVTVATDTYGKLAVAYATLSPNGFFVGDVLTTMACKSTTFKLIAPWLGTGVQPLNLDILSADGTMKLATKVIQATDGLTQTVDGLPATAMQYRVSTVSTAEVLAQGTIADPCAGAQMGVTLASPSGTIDNVTLSLTVTCPGKGTITPPDFDLFYKLSSSSGAFQLLGTVSGGILKTTLLKIGSVYDFRVNWGAETTTVKSRTITASDSTTGGGGTALSVQACGVN